MTGGKDLFIYFFFNFAVIQSQTERKEQHFTPGVFTCMKLPEDKQDECSQTSLYEISRNRLRVIEKLGEGNFGMVSTLPPSPSPAQTTRSEDLAKRDWNARWYYLINDCQFRIILYTDPLMRDGRDTRVQCHVDVPQKTSDRQIAAARLWRTKQVSGVKWKIIWFIITCYVTRVRSFFFRTLSARVLRHNISIATRTRLRIENQFSALNAALQAKRALFTAISFAARTIAITTREWGGGGGECYFIFCRLPDENDWRDK